MKKSKGLKVISHDVIYQTIEDYEKYVGSLKEEIEKKIKDFKKKNNLDNLGDIEKEVDILDTDAEAKQKEIQDARQQQQNLLREKDRIEMQIQSVDEKINKVLELQKENKSQLEELKYKKEEFKKKLASGEIEIIDGKVVDHSKPKKKKVAKKKKKAAKKKTTKKKSVKKKA